MCHQDLLLVVPMYLGHHSNHTDLQLVCQLHQLDLHNLMANDHIHKINIKGSIKEDLVYILHKEAMDLPAKDMGLQIHHNNPRDILPILLMDLLLLQLPAIIHPQHTQVLVTHNPHPSNPMLLRQVALQLQDHHIQSVELHSQDTLAILPILPNLAPTILM